MFRKIQIHFQTFWKKYIILFLFNVAFILVVLSIRGFSVLVHYCDAFFAATGINFGIGLLSLLSYFGAMNGISYIGHYLSCRVASMFKRDAPLPSKYQDYLAVKEEKKKGKLFHFIPYFGYGVLLLIITIILFCLL
ncbi:MAG: hypothetical protein NC310_00120 [Roseburia sp.]|nr:hypothetical protein [Anaeroplasma bactoclasticum]MCM1195459.1 hypothetical protein [Roseburia sp.]MCM1555938.1 hypothetical protein [Anaeroplasma bactoclasticum]